MTNKFVFINIVWTCTCSDEKSLHWLNIIIDIENTWLFELGMSMEMKMRMYIYDVISLLLVYKKMKFQYNFKNWSK